MRHTPNGQVGVALVAQCIRNKESLLLKFGWPVDRKLENTKAEESMDSLATTEDLRSASRSAFLQIDYRRAREIGDMIEALDPATAMADQFKQIKPHRSRATDDES